MSKKVKPVRAWALLRNDGSIQKEPLGLIKTMPSEIPVVIVPLDDYRELLRQAKAAKKGT